MPNTPARAAHRRRNLFSLIPIVLAFSSTVCLPVEFPKGTSLEAIQFDAIVELNAPHVRRHTVLFTRYWVSSDNMTLAIIWTEPHIDTPHFPLYPVTLTITSNTEGFYVNSQMNPLINASFAKPVGERGVFRYMFGDYPVTNLRFAEEEALRLRLYEKDFKEISGKSDPNGEYSIDLRENSDTPRRNTPMAGIRGRASNGRLQSLDILDNNDRILKGIEYTYSNHILHQQEVHLPETLIPVGLQSGHITVTVNETKHKYTDFESTYREGARKCTVDYELVPIGDAQTPMPSTVRVRHAGSGAALRGARLANFRPVTSEPNDITRLAKDASHFDPKILETRRLVLKYRRKDPGSTTEEDRAILKALATHFTNCTSRTQTIGEDLRRINMLLQIAWVLADEEQLALHFQTYLNALASHGLGKTLLLGGRHVIETTILWQYLDMADTLLPTWARMGVSSNKTEAILEFAREEFAKGRFWTLAKLMSELAREHKGRPEISSAAHYLRCKALCRLRDQLCNPEDLRREVDIMQIGWVSRSMSPDALLGEAKSSYNMVKRVFESTPEPSDAQRKAWGDLQIVMHTLTQAETSGSATSRRDAGQSQSRSR